MNRGLSIRNCGWFSLLLAAAAAVVLAVVPAGRLWRGQGGQQDPELAEARRLEQVDRLDQAEILVAAYVRQHPESPEGRFLWSRVLRRLGRMSDAEVQLRRSERLGWDKSAVEREHYLALWQQGNFAKAGPVLDRLLSEGDAHPEDIYEVRVLEALESYHTGEAGVWLEKWVAQVPDSVRGRMLLAWGYEQGHRWKMAESEYRRAVSADPGNANARRSLGNVLLQLGRADEALEEFESCRQLDGGDPATVRGIVACHENLGQSELALPILEGAVRTFPKNAALWAELGKLEWQHGHMPEADRSLAVSLELDPYHPDVHYTMAQVQQRLDRTTQAEYHRTRAGELQALGKRLLEISERLRLQPQDAELRYEAAMLDLQRGKYEDALLYLKSVLQYDPGHRATHAALAELYEKSGNVSQAAFHRARVRTGGGRDGDPGQVRP